jgi:methyl-accepting chemotaxis protein
MKILVDEINLGSQQQSKGIDQISRTIHEMEKVTQGTASNAEESAAAAEQLTAQSQSVMEIVDHLNALVGVSASSYSCLRSNIHRISTNGARKPPAFRQALRSMKGAVHLASVPKLAVRTSVRPASNVSSFPLDDREFKEFLARVALPCGPEDEPDATPPPTKP